MNHKGIITAIIIFGLIIVGMFVFAFLKKSELEEKPLVTDTPNETKSPYNSITRIDGKHFFIDGKHTLVGEILVPTPCDLLNWDPVVMESMPEQVRVDFTLVNNTDSCVQTVTPQRFFVEFSANEKATISATVNGRSVIFNLVPAAEGETPENYEFAAKG